MLRVHADDARVVDHFREDHDRVGSLHNLVKVVVEVIRQHWWSRRRAKSEQTSLAERAAFGIIVGPGWLESRVSVAFTCIGSRTGGDESQRTLTRLRSERRNLPVSRVDHNRRSFLAIDRAVVRSAVEPERVVTA